MYGSRFLPLLILAATLGLASCDTAEERAQGHYERAKALLAEGDAERAIIEFRNVFRLDGNNAAARLDYANLLVERGELQEAISQFLRLVEQDWSNVAGHRQLADLALRVGDFTTAETHADRAYELDPDDPRVRALKATVDYHDGEHEAAVAMARGVVEEAPDNLIARMVLIAERMGAGDAEGALALVDAALAIAPEDEGLHLARLAVIERTGDRAAVGEQLVRMARLFPDNDGVAVALIQWHLQAGDIDAAEPLLRARAAAQVPGTPERIAADLALAQALLETRGAAAARGELEQLIAAAADPTPYRRVLAGLDVSQGRTEAGIAALRAIIAGAEASDERRDTQIELARILAETGDTAASGELVDAVIAEDPGHVAALKLRARRLIEADQPETAIRDLRTALNQAPQDTETLTLMAMAHEREGARELAGERLALAVEVSDSAPAESIRYARFLMQDDRIGPAEAVVAEALRRRPSDPELLTLLGRIRLGQGDWRGAGEIVDRLRALGTPAATAQAAALEAQVLNGQNRFSEAIETLEKLADERPALAGIVETYVRAGDLAGARRYLEGILERTPEAPLPRLMLAGIAALAGDEAAAEAGYRALIADAPDFAPAYEGLYLLLGGAGGADAAGEVLEAGLAATGEDPRLLFLRAGRLELEGDVEGAIAVYERLYARDSTSPLVANNLASLLSSHRDDPASQERAFTIARRLRGTEVPHFQDTYGWIVLGRGEAEEALPYLEEAATALPDQPLVFYHLGVAQARLGRPEAARASLERALAAAAPAPLPEARALLDALTVAPAPEETPARD